ncbi:MAG: hypothetical protein EOP87_19485 [Verrucomicrobiaceae bacterium]|nr:MAG: hypothetical protein EOP87_19485 [Verrucomicrobiaceae bacterium]
MRISPKLPLVLALAAMVVVVFTVNSPRKQESARTAPAATTRQAEPVAARNGEAGPATPAVLPPTDPVPTAAGDEQLFSGLGNLEKGTILSLPLPSASVPPAAVALLEWVLE